MEVTLEHFQVRILYDFRSALIFNESFAYLQTVFLGADKSDDRI